MPLLVLQVRRISIATGSDIIPLQFHHENTRMTSLCPIPDRTERSAMTRPDEVGWKRRFQSRATTTWNSTRFMSKPTFTFVRKESPKGRNSAKPAQGNGTLNTSVNPKPRRFPFCGRSGPFQLSQEPTRKNGPLFEAWLRGAERALAPFFAATFFSPACISCSAAFRNFQVTFRPSTSQRISSCMQSEGSGVTRKFLPWAFPGPSTPSPRAVG